MAQIKVSRWRTFIIFWGEKGLNDFHSSSIGEKYICLSFWRDCEIFREETTKNKLFSQISNRILSKSQKSLWSLCSHVNHCEQIHTTHINLHILYS